MFFDHPCEDEDVVQVYDYDLFCNQILEDIVYHGLEGCQTVSHPKEHYQRFKEASVCLEDSLPFVSGLDIYVVETPVNV